MNSDQKMVATLGLVLILLVLLGTYRQAIHAILFNSTPQGGVNIGPNLLGGVSQLLNYAPSTNTGNTANAPTGVSILTNPNYVSPPLKGALNSGSLVT